MEDFSIEKLRKGNAKVTLCNPCRIICTDLKSNTPIVVAIEYPTGEKLRMFDANGFCSEANLQLVIDGVPESKKETNTKKIKK